MRGTLPTHSGMIKIGKHWRAGVYPGSEQTADMVMKQTARCRNRVIVNDGGECCAIHLTIARLRGRVSLGRNPTSPRHEAEADVVKTTCVPTSVAEAQCVRGT